MGSGEGLLTLVRRLARRARAVASRSPFSRFEKSSAAGVTAVRLEADSRCQLKCPLCPTALGVTRTSAVGWGRLTFDRFRTFVDSNPAVRAIELSNYGEIFLNPDLERIAEYAHEAGVTLSATNGVNLNGARASALEAVVRHPFRAITVSIDGASEETYAFYRRGGSLARVLANVRTIVEHKRRYGSERPFLQWQFVVFGHNEHELESAWRMARDLGMEFRPKMSWDPAFSPLRDEPKVRRILAAIDGEAASDPRKRLEQENRRYCSQVWITPQINWDGTLLGCCVNHTTALGNVFEQGLEGALESPSYRRLKRVLHGYEEATDDLPCASCSVYTDSLLPLYRARFERRKAVRRFLRRAA